MLGHKLVQVLSEKFDVWTTIREGSSSLDKYGFFQNEKIVEKVDITDFESVKKAVDALKPDIVINCVGIIKQLPVSKNVIKTLMVNSIFPQQLAELAAGAGFRLFNISTDCVFKGTSGNYSESDEPDAADLYGKSKNLGEVLQENCLTIRTSIIGRELDTEHSLVEWFLSNQGQKIKGYENAIYSGFPTIIFADIITDLIINYKNLQGLYHISSEPINKFELLKLIRKAYRADIEIEPFADFKVDRSLNSDKFRKETGFTPLNWSEMIEKMAADPTPYSDWRK